MVYALKFVASWILPPGLFVILMLALVVKLFRVDRKLSIAVFLFTTIFYLLCTSFVAEKMMGWLESVYSPPAQIETSGADVIVMLGGGAIGQVPDVDGVGVLCASPASRLLAAVRLQKILNVPILVSGGQVYSDSGAEAEIAARILKSLGVPEDKILTETRSVNTSQNARYSAAILREKNFEKPILVTSAFHMRRAMLNFRLNRFLPIPYPTDYTVARDPTFHYTKMRPQSEALLLNVTVMQEVLRTIVTEIFKI
ncbi:MAG: YdcF family protein [Selenomonadaceae bacterium]|nr:YdcF family protein [Selenomonadaceae bacterium]MBR4383828.1 YdcF family protein [Selenomonadaceae bacterium]